MLKTKNSPKFIHNKLDPRFSEMTCDMSVLYRRTRQTSIEEPKREEQETRILNKEGPYQCVTTKPCCE